MAALARIDVLLIDDLFLRPLGADHAAHLLEVIEDRHKSRSTVLGSQLPIAGWHDAIGDATIADAVLDRVLEQAYRLELDGDSREPPGSTRSPKRRRMLHDREEREMRTYALTTPAAG